jgi:glycosyltransferase involved in cell wall biosynthesis
MFLHRNLTFGGAEMLIVDVAAGLKKRGHDVIVVTFYAENPIGGRLAQAGVPLESLHKKGRWHVVGFLRRFQVVVRQFRPDVIYTLLPVPNLVAFAARFAIPHPKLIWGVSIADLDHSQYDFLSRLSYWLETILARFADLVISNSRAGARYAVRRGFPETTMRTVPVGVDMARYRPDRTARDRTRSEWRFADGDKLVGLVGRLDPQKDIPTFLAAAAKIAEPYDLRFVVIGNGPAEYRQFLIARCDELGISSRTMWLAARLDIEAIYNALDLMVMSSAAEGSSVAVVQAMACGTSVVATDVGDSALELGPWGELVPPKDPSALAHAIIRQLKRLETDHERIAAGCRRHIQENFSIDMVVAETEALMLSLCVTEPPTALPIGHVGGQ